MSKEDFIIQVGTVAESLPNATFRVEIEGQSELILCHLSGKMRKYFIKVLPGDRVTLEMSPYDLTKGRIVRRLKPGEDPFASTQPPTEAVTPSVTDMALEHITSPESILDEANPETTDEE